MAVLGKQAVVIGASMAGLAAARVLADNFEQVTVLERDSLPTEPSVRAGTPQARHIHVFLAGGLQALETLFPGFREDLLRAGAVPLRSGLDVLFERPLIENFPKRDLGMTTYALSRPLLEFTLRQRVCTLRNIACRSECRVTEILASPDGVAVQGVAYEDAGKGKHTLTADMVIDASGRGAPTLNLLSSIGKAPPTEAVIGVDMGYATALYEPPQVPDWDFKGLTTFPAAPQTSRAGFLYPVEKGRYLLALGGRGQDKPPGDERGFLEFAKSLRTSTIFNVISRSNRIGEIVRYAFPKSVRRDFKSIEGFPRGLLPLGDAICIFNPVYGQGMSVAAQEAVTLQRLLSQMPQGTRLTDSLTTQYFEAVETILETPWVMAAIPDFVFPETTGERPEDLEQSLQFGAALTRLAFHDADLHRLMMEVQMLLKPRSVYREPALIARVRQEIERYAAGG
jgi:2-polyprenyl-6-methoxyphenol hydroxylase-like FAD-dependent oxidoreductase